MSELPDKEKAAARVLGCTGKIWDNESGLEAQAFLSIKTGLLSTSIGHSSLHVVIFALMLFLL